MKSLTLLVVGRLKDQNLQKLENEYLKRIKSINFNIVELKANSLNKESEGQLILKKIDEFKKNSQVRVCALTETGKQFNSPEFSNYIYKQLETNSQVLFIIAGAEGFCPELLKNCDAQLSLSNLTFPHKIARLIFIEQIYRAITIKEKHPYHN